MLLEKRNLTNEEEVESLLGTSSSIKYSGLSLNNSYVGNRVIWQCLEILFRSSLVIGLTILILHYQMIYRYPATEGVENLIDATVPPSSAPAKEGVEYLRDATVLTSPLATEQVEYLRNASAPANEGVR